MKNIFVMIITLTVGVILAGALLAPVIDDATNHTEILHNDVGQPTDRPYTFADDSPVTFGYDADGYYVNGEHFSQLGANYATITSDGIVLRQGSGGGSLAAYVPSLDKSYVPPYSFTANNGTITGTVIVNDEETTITASYTYLYYQDADGDYVMTGANSSNFYLLKDTEYYCSGYNTSLGSGTARWFFMSGSIEDGFTFKYGANTVTDYTVNATQLEQYEEEVYEVTSIVFHVSESLDITVNRGIAPAEIVVTKIHDNGLDDIFSVIPIVAILVLVVAAMSYLMAFRRD